MLTFSRRRFLRAAASLPFVGVLARLGGTEPVRAPAKALSVDDLAEIEDRMLELPVSDLVGRGTDRLPTPGVSRWAHRFDAGIHYWNRYSESSD